jgi:hypothetical protein
VSVCPSVLVCVCHRCRRPHVVGLHVAAAVAAIALIGCRGGTTNQRGREGKRPLKKKRERERDIEKTGRRESGLAGRAAAYARAQWGRLERAQQTVHDRVLRRARIQAQ